MSQDEDQRKPAATDREWLANIYDFLSEADDLTDDEVREGLKTEGIDPGKLVNRGLAFIEQQRKLATNRMLAEARERQRQALGGFTRSKHYEGTLAQLQAMVKERLVAWSSQGISQFAIAHRNFEGASENDLRALLAEMDQLELLRNQKDEQGK